VCVCVCVCVGVGVGCACKPDDVATLQDLQTLPRCSEAKARSIMRLRPFADFESLRESLDAAKGLSSAMIDYYVDFIKEQQVQRGGGGG
jgi:hypothetical protein